MSPPQKKRSASAGLGLMGSSATGNHLAKKLRLAAASFSSLLTRGDGGAQGEPVMASVDAEAAVLVAPAGVAAAARADGTSETPWLRVSLPGPHTGQQRIGSGRQVHCPSRSPWPAAALGGGHGGPQQRQSTGAPGAGARFPSCHCSGPQRAHLCCLATIIGWQCPVDCTQGA